jgi:hypothetical protein
MIRQETRVDDALGLYFDQPSHDEKQWSISEG